VRWFVFLLSFCAGAAPVEVRLHVQDPMGNPVVGFKIWQGAKAFLSDSEGSLQLTTSDQALVLRKDGFEPLFLKVGEGGDFAIRMSRRGDWPKLRTCGANEATWGVDQKLEGYGLRFPALRQFAATKLRFDTDYAMRGYQTRKKPVVGVQHGRGYAWSLGIPLQSDLNDSVSYEERHFRIGEMELIDGRGVDRLGRKWRYLGMLGESASYRGVDAKAAEVLDRFLDGVCEFKID
jgi:hypothetical protein